MGKLTISMAIFNSYVNVYQAGYLERFLTGLAMPGLSSSSKNRQKIPPKNRKCDG